MWYWFRWFFWLIFHCLGYCSVGLLVCGLLGLLLVGRFVGWCFDDTLACCCAGLTFTAYFHYFVSFGEKEFVSERRTFFVTFRILDRYLWRSVRKISGYPEILRQGDILNKNGTFENFGDALKFPENGKFRKNGTYQHFVGARKFPENTNIWKNGTSEHFGGIRIYP